MTDSLEFEIDNNAMYELIYGQAGSLEKAYLELVQNSVDAHATAVDIDLPPEGDRFCVSDDGIGFRNKQEIKDYFARVGFDHSTLAEQRKYGRFGLGRLQVLCFASTLWKTGAFTLGVDIKRNGLKIDQQEHDSEQWRGCRIEGEFYERKDTLELNAIVRELTDMVAYAPIPVRINGKAVNKTPAECSWTFEDDDAYYSFRNNATSLTVYNMGVKVCAIPAHRYGVGGVVVSKQALELNIARNDILLSKCERFKRIAKVLRKYAVDESKSKPKRLNNARREALLQQWIAGAVSLDDVVKLNLFPTMKGYTSLERLRFDNWTVAPCVGNSVAEYLHRNGDFKVLDPVVLEWAGVSSAAEFAESLYQAYLASVKFQTRMRPYIDFFTAYDDASKGISETFTAIARKDLTRRQRAVVYALEQAMSCCTAAIYRATGDRVSLRHVQVGASDAAEAWTDGKNTIWFNIEHVDAAIKSDERMAALIPLMLHELCHDGPDSEAHSHDLEFFERYHEASMFLPWNTAFNRLAVACNKQLERDGERVPAWMQRAASRGVLNNEIPLHFEDTE